MGKTFTIQDCLLLFEFGYFAILENGHLKGFCKEG